MKWKPNPGHCPPEARGKRVIVLLVNGKVCGDEPVSSVTPPGWSADDKGACRWTITGFGWDIANYFVLR